MLECERRKALKMGVTIYEIGMHKKAFQFPERL
jgi:hypothetical protein